MDQKKPLRIRKKEQTRAKISAAALGAFQARGYENVTLEEIADAVDIHTRTLLRYFPSKMHLALHEPYEGLAQFRDELARRGNKHIVGVWRMHVMNRARRMLESPDRLYIYGKHYNDPSLRGASLSIQAEYRQTIRDALVETHGASEENMLICHIASAALVGANYSISNLAFREGDYDALEARLLDVIDMVTRAFPQIL